MNERFYQKILMDHYKNPRNKQKIENSNFTSGEDNPSCGDKVSMSGIIQDGIIKEIGFDGSGCVISMATTSLLTEKCKDMPIKEVLALTKDDVLQMIGLTLGPNRLKCALLPLETLQKGVLLYCKERGDYE